MNIHAKKQYVFLYQRNDKSRMRGDFHVRFCERFTGETSAYLLGGTTNHPFTNHKPLSTYFFF